MTKALSKPKLLLPKLRPDQWEIAQHPAKTKIVIMGRRWGKSTLAGCISLASAVYGAHVAWVVPTYMNGRPLWRWAEAAVGPMTKYGARLNKSERTITFPSQGIVTIYSADNPDAVRGEDFHLVIMDEAALIAESTYTDVLMPTLADHDGELIAISTPRGQNWLYKEYLRGLDDGKLQASFHAPTSANPNPNIQRAFAAVRERVPERTFREEWLAEFVDDEGAVFRRISEAVYGPLGSVAHDAARRYVAGLDWGQNNDFTVMVVIDTVSKQVVDIDRFNQIGWAVQRDRVQAMAQRWHVDRILAESNSIGGPNIEALQAQGLNVVGFETTNDTKADIIQALALAFERGDIHIPQHDAMIAELKAFEAIRLPSTRWRYTAPSGMHDDTVMALALAWHASTYSTFRDVIFIDW